MSRSRQFTAQSVLHGDCHFRQLRAGQGTEGSRDCRTPVASAYGETALQTVFANAPSHSGNTLSFAKALRYPSVRLAPSCLSESTISIAPLTHAVADTLCHISPTHRGLPTLSHQTPYTNRLTSQHLLYNPHPLVIEQSAFMNDFPLSVASATFGKSVIDRACRGRESNPCSLALSIAKQYPNTLLLPTCAPKEHSPLRSSSRTLADTFNDYAHP